MATTNHQQSAKGNPVKLNLKSSDGKRFPISRPAALLSPAIKSKIEFEDGDEISILVGGINVPVERVTIPVPDVDGETLAAVIVYLNTHAYAGEDTSDGECMSDDELLADKEMEGLKRLLVAADKLGITGLYEVVAEKVARIIEGKSLDWIRGALGVVDDYSPEEKDELRLQNWWVDWVAEDERVRVENEAKRLN